MIFGGNHGECSFATSAVTAIDGLIDQEKVVVKNKIRVKFTSVIDGECPDLCLKTGVLFLLTVLPPNHLEFCHPIAYISVHFPARNMRILAWKRRIMPG